MRRRVGLFLVCGLVCPLVLAATASGQGAQLLVTDPSPAPGESVVTVTPGQAITVTGNFSGTAPSSPVQIHLNTRSGRLLTSTAVTSGRISATFPVPADLTPGWYLLVATQTTNANGRHAAFSPGRTRIKVRAAGAGASAPGGGRWGSPLGLLAMGFALLLLATGATLTVRRSSLKRRPVDNWPTQAKAPSEGSR